MPAGWVKEHSLKTDSVFSLAKAAQELNVSTRTLSGMIKRGCIPARRTAGNKGKYIILESVIIDYLKCSEDDRPASMGVDKGELSCQSPSGAEYGTVISLPRQAKELGDRLALRTRNRH
nr:helix-turn-helix domain-containing protein [Tatumella morbirosei]